MRANSIKSGEDYDNKWRRIKQQITWWKKTSGRAVAMSQNIIQYYNKTSDNQWDKKTRR